MGEEDGGGGGGVGGGGCIDGIVWSLFKRLSGGGRVALTGVTRCQP